MNKAHPNRSHSIDLGFTHEKFPSGLHLCYIYRDEEERYKNISSFINTGLQSHDGIVYFADLESTNLLNNYLHELGISPELEADNQDHINYQIAKNVYCPDNIFDMEKMFLEFEQLEHKCCQTGACLRITGEMTWALSPNIKGVENLVEYEARLNPLIEQKNWIAICQYDANKFDPELLFDIVQVHPMMLVRGQVIHNPYYLPVQEYLARHNPG